MRTTALRRRQGLRSVLASAALMAACSSSDPESRPDASDDAGTGRDASALTEPDPPDEPMAPGAAALPVLTPCPPGWHERAVAGGGTVCDPWPGDGPADCTGAEAHFPGRSGCQRIGPECPEARFAAGLPSDRPLLFVDALAAPGGTGSEEAPFSTVGDAMAVAAPTTIVALASGTYDEEIVIAPGVELWGTCVARTVLRPTSGRVALRAGGAGTVVRAVRIEGSIEVGPLAGSLHVEDAIVEGAIGVGVTVRGRGRMTGERLVVRGTARLPDGTLGDGLQVTGGGTLSLIEASFEVNHTVGAFVSDTGSLLRLTATVIRDTLPDPAGYFGRAIEVVFGGRVEAVRSAFERNRDIGVLVLDEGSTATLTEVVIRATEADSDGWFGRGVEAGRGGRAELRRVLVRANREAGVLVAGGSLYAEDLVVTETLESVAGGMVARALAFAESADVEARRVLVAANREAGVVVNDAGTSARLEDLVIRDTRERSRDGSLGIGLNVQGGSRLELSRALLDQNRLVAMVVNGTGTQATVTDLVIRRTLPGVGGAFGRALEVSGAASLGLERAVLEDNGETGALAAGPGTRLRLVDATVRATRSDADGNFGRGVVVQQGASAEAVRLVCDGNRDVGLLVAGAETSVRIDDVTVRDTGGAEATGRWGRGIQVQGGARLDGARVRLERNREAGLAVAEPGSSARLEHVEIRQSLERDCVRDSCAGAGSGVGAVALADGSIELRRFVVTDNALCGLQLARGGTADLHEGEVSHQPVGVNLTTEGFDVTRLMDRVVFRDNGVDLDSSVLPVPDAVGTEGL